MGSLWAPWDFTQTTAILCCPSLSSPVGSLAFHSDDSTPCRLTPGGCPQAGRQRPSPSRAPGRPTRSPATRATPGAWSHCQAGLPLMRLMVTLISHLASPPPSSHSLLLCAACYLLPCSVVSAVCCQLSAVCCLLSVVCFVLSALCSLLFAVLSAVCRLSAA